MEATFLLIPTGMKTMSLQTNKELTMQTCMAQVTHALRGAPSSSGTRFMKSVAPWILLSKKSRDSVACLPINSKTDLRLEK
jgi:hypothetical protein